MGGLISLRVMVVCGVFVKCEDVKQGEVEVRKGGSDSSTFLFFKTTSISNPKSQRICKSSSSVGLRLLHNHGRRRSLRHHGHQPRRGRIRGRRFIAVEWNQVRRSRHRSSEEESPSSQRHAYDSPGQHVQHRRRGRVRGVSLLRRRRRFESSTSRQDANRKIYRNDVLSVGNARHVCQQQRQRRLSTISRLLHRRTVRSDVESFLPPNSTRIPSQSMHHDPPLDSGFAGHDAIRIGLAAVRDPSVRYRTVLGPAAETTILAGGIPLPMGCGGMGSYQADGIGREATER